MSGLNGQFNSRLQTLERSSSANERNYTAEATVNRGTIDFFDCTSYGKICVLSAQFTSSVSATNSPQIMRSQVNPLNECALSCIDITDGLDANIETSVPCGISADGRIYLKTTVSGHKYLISVAFKV